MLPLRWEKLNLPYCLRPAPPRTWPWRGLCRLCPSHQPGRLRGLFLARLKFIELLAERRPLAGSFQTPRQHQQGLGGSALEPDVVRGDRFNDHAVDLRIAGQDQLALVDILSASAGDNRRPPLAIVQTLVL